MSPLAPAPPSPFTLSIVLEWENYLTTDDWRATANMRTLRQQVDALVAGPHDPQTPEGAWLGSLRGPVELVMVYDPGALDVTTIQALATAELAGAANLAVSWLGVPAGRYYDLKNASARAASGDLVFFTDSDVVMHADWLEQLLKTFHRPEVQLATGVSYVKPTDFLSRAFALAWLFPVPPAEDGPVTTLPHFQAHNFGIQRALFLANPFPDEPERERGPCVNLAKSLRAQGVPVYLNPRARVAHPRPEGLGYMLARTLSKGPELLYDVVPRPGFVGMLGHAAKGTLKRMVWSARNILRDHRRVDLPLWQVPGAIAVMAAFYSLFGVGMAWYYVAPAHHRRHLRL